MNKSYRAFKSCIAIVLLAVSAFTVQAGDTKADEAAIRDIIARWDTGWANFDALTTSQDYADAADWTNAFGVSKRGRQEIQLFLENLYKSPQITPRRSTPSKTVIRFLSPDIAVAASYRETVGQKTSSGAEYPTRKTRDLRVLSRDGGHWLIVSHLIADEKQVLP